MNIYNADVYNYCYYTKDKYKNILCYGVYKV